jgi:hypothetical protein
MLDPKEIHRTPNGGTIESIGNGNYRVCDKDLNCAIIEGLWKAHKAMRQKENNRTHQRFCRPHLSANRKPETRRTGRHRNGRSNHARRK